MRRLQDGRGNGCGLGRATEKERSNRLGSSSDNGLWEAVREKEDQSGAKKASGLRPELLRGWSCHLPRGRGPRRKQPGGAAAREEGQEGAHTEP